MTHDTSELVERAKRWAANTGYNGNFDSVPMRMISTLDQQSAEIARLREALHAIDIEAGNTIPPDGKEAAFAALRHILRIIGPFRLHRCPTSLDPSLEGPSEKGDGE